MTYVGEEYERVWIEDGDWSHVDNVKWRSSSGDPKSTLWGEEHLDVLARVILDSPYMDIRVERGLGDLLAKKIRSLMLKAAAKDEGNHVILSYEELDTLVSFPAGELRSRLLEMLPEDY